MNAFKFQTPNKDDIVVMSQSATIIRSKDNQPMIVSSANYLFKYLDEQLHKSTLTKQDMAKNVRFLLARSSTLKDHDYKESDFDKLKLVKIV